MINNNQEVPQQFSEGIIFGLSCLILYGGCIGFSSVLFSDLGLSITYR